MEKVRQETDLTAFREWFSMCPGALVAFSGGVDSSLVAFLARTLLGKARVVAVISASPSLKLGDLDAAKAFCLAHDIPLKVIRTSELDNPDYFTNPANRCYFCKHTLYGDLDAFARDFGGWWILNGTNHDDLGDYRPGIEAGTEFQVRSPLAECHLRKPEVRALASALGLECWDKPASPCLSSRIPYGQRVTEKKLRQIEAGEVFLNKLGFPIVRVRHNDGQAVVEVPGEQVPALQRFADTVSEHLLELGFQAVEIDPEGFVSGKLNRSLL